MAKAFVAKSIVTNVVISAVENRSPATNSTSFSLGLKVGIEIRHPLLASLDQRWNLGRSQCGPEMARPFKPAAAFRTPSMTEAKPSSSARRSHMVMSAFSFGVAPSSGTLG